MCWTQLAHQGALVCSKKEQVGLETMDPVEGFEPKQLKTVSFLV